MVVWITGATRGIGLAIARRFAAEGHAVAVTGRSAKELDAIAAEALTGGRRMHSSVCDVTDEVSVLEAHRRIEGELGPVDVLVNNAGASVFHSFADTSSAELRLLLDTNVRGAFHCTQAVLPSMLERRGGTVVMINSIASREALPKSAAYAASKAALKSLADCLRLEVRGAGVRVISIYPGATLTEIWPSKVRERSAEKMMKAEEVAEVVHAAVTLPGRVLVEDLYVQPIGGPLA